MDSDCAMKTFSWFIAALVLLGAAASADWNQGELPLNPQLHAWFNSLSSKLAPVCCNEADGRPAESWGYEGDHYVVTVFGRALTVPDGAVVQTPNRMGE